MEGIIRGRTVETDIGEELDQCDRHRGWGRRKLPYVGFCH